MIRSDVVVVTLPTHVKEAIQRVAHDLAAIEAAPSTAGLPAGAATGGQSFEAVAARAWTDFAAALTSAGCQVSAVRSGPQMMCCLALPTGNRRLYLFGRPPSFGLQQAEPYTEVPVAWARRRFVVSELVHNHLGVDVLKFAPRDQEDSPSFYGANYPNMFEGKTTTFDFTAVLEEGDVLREKLLFEYKSAKSSRGYRVDGNAHERLSFQTLQYLEIAAMLPNTSFNVIASSAFSKYKNKYHVSFNQHSIRLGDAFRSFVMRVAACRSEYERFFGMLAGWLLTGSTLLRDYRRIDVR